MSEAERVVAGYPITPGDEDFKAGKLAGIAEFAAAARGVFYKCYYTYGASPDAHYLSKACEKVDLIFEQQVVLLPRSMREQAVMPQPQRDVEEQELADGVERRRSDRARVGTQMCTTQMLVEQEKRRRRGEEAGQDKGAEAPHGGGAAERRAR